LAANIEARVASPRLGDAPDTRRITVADCVDAVEELLRRLALNDEKSLGMVLASDSAAGAEVALVPKVDLLVRLGALVAVGAATPSLRRIVKLALGAGATEAEIVGVLVAVAPTVGLARVVDTAPKLATAIGYDTAASDH
jgi:alkylhydroperoxidase/carboxymuconolactone decarboxylase family protein YurZ